MFFHNISKFNRKSRRIRIFGVSWQEFTDQIYIKRSHSLSCLGKKVRTDVIHESLIYIWYAFSLFSETADIYSLLILFQLISGMIYLSCCIFQMDLVIRIRVHCSIKLIGILLLGVETSGCWMFGYCYLHYQQRFKFIFVLLFWKIYNRMLHSIWSLPVWIKMVSVTTECMQIAEINDCQFTTAIVLSWIAYC